MAILNASIELRKKRPITTKPRLPVSGVGSQERKRRLYKTSLSEPSYVKAVKAGWKRKRPVVQRITLS